MLGVKGACQSTSTQASRSGMFWVDIATMCQTADASVEPFWLDVLLSRAPAYLFCAITPATLAKGHRNTPWGYSSLRNGSCVTWQQLCVFSSACYNLSKRRTAVFFFFLQARPRSSETDGSLKQLVDKWITRRSKGLPRILEAWQMDEIMLVNM